MNSTNPSNGVATTTWFPAVILIIAVVAAFIFS
jgi:hypothetical protein